MGTVIGRDHRLAGKNNQDAFCCLAIDRAIVCVVCDGCGSRPHSEVGAKVGARLIASQMSDTVSGNSDYCRPIRKDDWEFLLACVYNKPFLQEVEALAVEMTRRSNEVLYEFNQTILDYFLFTAVGAIVTEESVAVFSAGDGVFGINFRTGGFVNVLEPFPDNAPPYPAYRLIGSSAEFEPDQLGFKLQTVQRTRDVTSIIIGTDGTADLKAASKKNVPGRDEIVGRLQQFWENDLYFRNPDALRRRLTVLNADVTKTNWDERRLMKYPGLLRDDTTLAVIRRRKT